MAGFTAIICKNKNIDSKHSFREKNVYGHEQNHITNFVITEKFVIEHFTNKKFIDDKILAEDSSYIIGIEGVILNLKHLKAETKQANIFDVVKCLYESSGIDFVKRLKGSFSGFIYSKKDQKWQIFTDPIGSKRLFYFQNETYFIFASELRDISFQLSSLGIQNSLNHQAAYLLLTYGYMMEDISLIDNVKRIQGGIILSYQNESISTKEYFHLRNIKQTKDSSEEIIEKMDQLFTNAIKMEFEKDKEYGYKHIATLSGGLDSRMTVLMAHKLGYSEQLNFTFSQSDYLDEKIAKKIASDHKHEFLFQSLDHGNYLKQIDKTTYYNDGLILYSGSAHVMRAIENMNFDSYGMIHTGLVGDAVIGSFLSKPFVVPPTVEMGAYSKKLLAKVTPFILEILPNYASEELFKFYGRGFSGALNGNYYFDIFSQTVSPFLEIDFLTYCYSIPEDKKYKQKIYLEWIAKKHAEFAKYPWEKTGVSPLKSMNYKRYFDLGYYKRMSLKFFDKLSGKMKSGMNPFDFWLIENEGLKDTINAYFVSHIKLLDNNIELKQDCIQLFNNGNSGEKFQVLTLLSAIKLHNIKL